VKPETAPKRMDSSPDGKLRLGVLRSYAAHERSSIWRNGFEDILTHWLLELC
jgi:hypothetical protein